NLLLAAGVAISGAVLTGALIVGDSVKYSLNRIVELRLGKVTHVIRAGDRYFTDGLSDKIREDLSVPVSSVLLQEGIAVADGGSKRINHVNILGVDQWFDGMAGKEGYYSSLAGDSVIISQNLANRLNLGAGDELLLRIEKASLIPMNAPFVSDADNAVSVRVAIRDVAGEEELGTFNLRVSQTAPFNVFMARSQLESLMDFEGRVNVMLLDAGNSGAALQIREDLRKHFTAADAGLNMKYLSGSRQLDIKSARVFMDDTLSGYLLSEDFSGKLSGESAGDSAGGSSGNSAGNSAREASGTGEAEPVITYFVNSISTGNASTPYSFVSTLPEQELSANEIVLNQWLAGDLSAVKGDTVTLAYFVVGPLRELEEKAASFVVREVVPIEGRYADGTLMPDLPGLSDVGNCRDWETGVPIDLDKIRDRDEDYWDRYKGIPKAFISIRTAEMLWANRFGTFTAIRIPVSPGQEGALESSLLEGFDPTQLGFTLEDTRSRGVAAAQNGTDFTQLFGGLSFFLMVAGVLLTVLLYLLNLESRMEQLRTLVVMGIPLRTIRRIMLAEGMVVALVGALAGLLLSIVYNRLVFIAMNGVWSDVVRTEMMYMDVKGTTLVTGLAMTLAIALAALFFPLQRQLKKHFRSYRTGKRKEKGAIPAIFRVSGQRWFLIGYAGSGLVALALIASQLIQKEVVNASLFFTAGGLLLVSAVLFFIWSMARFQRGTERRLTLFLLSWKNALRNRTRSLSIILLFAIGAFLVISTGSNRKDLFRNANDPTGGSGGFLFYAESTVPVLKDLNQPAVKQEYGLSDGYSFVQMRRATGDDASCLNLNRVLNPQVLGVDPSQLKGRFSFVTRTGELNADDPWGSLDKELPGGLIPAIADETVIKWGLGLEAGDTLHYTNSNGGNMDLLLIGGTAPSIFQGNVLISDKQFLEEFPESSGSHVFLVDGPQKDTAQIRSELERGLRDLGWDMELTAARLVRFYSVTNTYLAIFMVMGALGLLVGTFGLVVVLSRSILERRQEIALLKAVGYGKGVIRRMVVREYLFLLLAGIFTGFVAAIVATLPSILSAHTGTSFTSIALWLAILVVNGWIWIQVVARSALKDRIINESLRND
ncbi:MAG: FtsX-like permease family protein, partial [Bacteroidales bacterium]